MGNRPIVVFNGDVSPTEMLEVIGNDFSGDIVVFGYLSDYNDDGSTVIHTHGGSLTIYGGISLYHDIVIEGDVFICDSVGEETKRNLVWDIESEGDIKIHGSLYAFEKDIDVLNLFVGGDVIAKTIQTLIVVVAGELELENPCNPELKKVVLG